MNDIESSNTKHYWLYVLLLNDDKYYIGRTTGKSPDRRINQHSHNFYSAQWVKRYGFLDEIERIDLGVTTKAEADRLETYRTEQYMTKYGYNNVRGGRYNYSGKYFKIGNNYMQDNYVYGIVGLCLMTISWLYLIITRGSR